MANKESESSPEFEQHELVERLRPDPNIPPPPDLLVVNGWRGKSNLEGYCRIYLTASLTDHVDYPCEDEVFSQSLTNEGSSLSQPPTQVRIKPSNNVLYTHTERHDPQRQLQFMVGPLSARFLPGTGSGGTLGGGVILKQPLAQRTSAAVYLLCSKFAILILARHFATLQVLEE